MNNEKKTKKQLIGELKQLRQRITEPEKPENRRKELEKALQISEENFRNIITNNADGIIILDKNGVVRFTNPAAKALFGDRADKLIGEPFGFPVIAGETTEIDILHGKERPVIAEMRLVKTEWEGEEGFLASLRDITHRKAMEQKIKQSLEDYQEVIRGTVQAMAMTVETRDPYTAGHQRRVAILSRAIAQDMELSPEQVNGLYMAALIHDVGKISVPSEFLSKPGQLTDNEFGLIKLHPQIGYDILKDIKSPWPILQIVLQHHERMNGSGYPQGLTGDDIILEARIIGIADVVEAMASHRPYRPGLGIDKALEEISKNRGTFYDPEIVDICVELFTKKGFAFS